MPARGGGKTGGESHSQFVSLFHQQLDHVAGPVDDAAHLLEAPVRQRHAGPFQHLRNDQRGLSRRSGTDTVNTYLVALLETGLLGRAAGHGPHDRCEHLSVRADLAAHDSHAEPAGCATENRTQNDRVNIFDSLVFFKKKKNPFFRPNTENRAFPRA